MPLTSYAKNKFIAPYLSELTKCNAIDMTGYSQPWVYRFINNTIVGINTNDRSPALRIMLLRRVEMSFYEHENGRLALQTYIKNPDAINLYMYAIFHFENYLAQSWQAYDILRRMPKPKVACNLFEPGDGTLPQRLNELYNLSKHFVGNIDSGKLPDDLTMPIWISNSGLCSAGVQLSFEEIAEILKHLSKVADALSNPTNP